ncbi:ribosomal RNA processing protein 1 homolog B isoform X2 [Manis pentadactyla]|uniref:ribosomal RNA processing protein 1 homolog B isoform X2 n=1 Tax=Manis pentadactyla TaxID=143292 RepID=UPI00255CA093|nr:ribosomal RNA processing protein 1 homolog B isoform X2 [Manis pentadactyla]
MAPAMQPAEIQFAQRLASHEKGIRDRAVKKLREYISVKTQRETGGFSPEELLKIWKGLFYCMWVQDEPLLQEELATSLSQLIHAVNNSEAQHLFIQTFWQTMSREWTGIDRLRLGRYHRLIRLVLRQSFEALKQNGWEESQIKLFLDILMKEILHPESQAPNGVKFHMIDIYLDELSKVGRKELLADQNLKFIDPFCRVAAKTKDHTLVQTIARGVFEVIVDQSPFVPEETIKEQRTKVGDSGLAEEGVPENKAAQRKTISAEKTAPGEHHSKKDGVGDEGERDSSGSVEDPRLLLQFDYKAVADRLREVTNRKNIPPFNRKRLSKLIKKFQELAEGSMPQLSFTEDISAGEDDQTLSPGRPKKTDSKLSEKPGVEEEAGNKFVPAEGENGGGVRKRRRRRGKSRLQPEHLGSKDGVSPEQNGDSEPDACPGRGQELSVGEPGAEAAPQAHSTRRQLRERSPKAWGEGTPLRHPSRGGSGSGPKQGPAPQASPASAALILKRKRKLGALPVNGSGPPTLAWPPPPEGPPASPEDGGEGSATLLQGTRLKKQKGEPNGLDLCNLFNQKIAILKKRRKMKEMSNLGSSGAFGPVKKKKMKTENGFVQFDTPFLPKSMFFRKAKRRSAASPSPAVQLKKTPSSSKKVTFGLSRNMTAEFKKTDKSSLVSPTGPSRVAFNPEQRPLHGVLKTPTNSPASAPLRTKKPLTTMPKRRPTAMDFF